MSGLLFEAVIADQWNGPQSKNVITRWNVQALDTVRTQRLGAAPASRLYAMVNVAMYDAVNGIDRARDRSHRDYALVPPSGTPRSDNRHAASSAAAHAVLTALHPELKETYDDLLDADLDNPGRHRQSNTDRGVSWGS